MSLRTGDICESMAVDYFGSTLRQIALCMIQFAKAVLVKMLHNIFGHNTDYVIYSSVCFAACLPATDLHDLLRDKFLLNNAVK